MTAIFPGHYRTALHFTTIEVEYWKYLKTEVTLHRLQNIGEFPDLSMQYFILISRVIEQRDRQGRLGLFRY